MQNAEILGIEHASPAPASISDMPQAHYRARGGSRIVASGRIAGQRAPLPRSGSASGAAGTFSAFGVAPTAYLPEGISDLAKGIYERSDALGINRALVSTMANVQRTVGAYASGGYNAHAPQRGADGFPPLAGSVRGHHVASASTGRFDSGSNANTPEGHVANAAELRKELAALKASNKAMGAAVGACVEVFERMWAEGASRGALKKGNDAVKTKEGLSGSSVPDSRSSPSSSISTSPSASRRPSANFKGGIKGTATEQTEDDDLSHAEIEMLMSLTALKHIRDVLSGAASEFDPSILGSPSPASSPVAASKLPAAHATGPNASVAPQMEAGGSGTPARTQAQQHQQGVSGSPTMHKAPLPSVIQAQRRASASPSAPPPSAGSLAASSSPMHTSNSGGQAAGSAQSSETASVSRAHAPYGGDSRDQNFGSVPAFSRTRVQAPFTHPPSASASAPAPRAFPQSQAANTQRSAPPSDPLSFVSASTSSNASHIGTHACRPSRPATATAASTFGTSQPRQHQQQQQRASSTAYPPSSFSSSSTSAFAPASQPDMNNLPNLNARPDDKSQTSPLGPVVSGASPIQAIRPSPPPPRAHSPVVRRSVQISGADPLGAS